MNLTDLRDELDLRASDIDHRGFDVAAGVHQKVRGIRRRRAAVASAACIAGLVVGGVALGNLTGQGPARPTPAATSATSPMLGTDGMPYRVVPDATGDVVKDGLRYRARVADDTLAVGAIGDKGQTRLTAEWTVTTTHVSFGGECLVPTPATEHSEELEFRVLLNGKTMFGGRCSAESEQLPDLSGSHVIPGDSRLTVGSKARLEAQYLDPDTGKPVSNPGVRLTVAAYDLGPRQPVMDADGETTAELADVMEHQGYRYTFIGMETAPASGPLPRMETPAGEPFLVAAGTSGSDSSSQPGTIYLTGLEGTPGSTSGGWQTVPVPARPAGWVGLRSEGNPPTGTAFIAIYTLER